MNGNLVRTFGKYVSLNVLGMIGVSCYILADTYFIANGIGTYGLAALNLILPLFSLMNGIGLMLGMGGATKYAHLLGAGRKQEANALFTKTVFYGLLTGLIITLCGLFFSTPIVVCLGADEAVHPLASVYLLTMYSFACAFVCSNIILAFVRNDGGPNRAMIAMIAGNLFNIVFDYLFIMKMRLGMFGAAFATGFSPAVTLLILSGHWRGSHTLAFVRRRIRCMGAVLAAGLPSFITEFASGLIILLFNFTILDLAGNTGVAAYGIIANLALIVTAAFTGIAQGIQPIVSLNHGAGNGKNANTAYFLAVCTALALGTAGFLTCVLFARPIIAVFNKQRDPILAAVALEGMRLYFTAFFLMGVNIVTSAFFSSVARFRASFLVSITRACLAAVPLILLLPRIFGITGVWLAIPLSELCTSLVAGVCVLRYFRSGGSKKDETPY